MDVKRHKDTQELGNGDTVSDDTNVTNIARCCDLGWWLLAQCLDSWEDELTDCLCYPSVDLLQRLALRKSKAAGIFASGALHPLGAGVTLTFSLTKVDLS